MIESPSVTSVRHTASGYLLSPNILHLKMKFNLLFTFPRVCVCVCVFFLIRLTISYETARILKTALKDFNKVQHVVRVQAAG